MNPAANSFAQFIPIILVFLIFYFILIRPQQQQRKKHEASLRGVKKGDEIVTAGGIIGEIVHIKTAAEGGATDQDRITIKSGESRFVIERRGITRIITPVVQEAKTPASGGSA